MNKYRIVGALNLFFGIGQILLSIGLFITLLRIQDLYSDFNVVQPSKIPSIAALILCFSLGAANSFIASKLLSQTGIHARYFKTGCILLLISLAAVGLISALTVFSTILPIYSLTSQF